MERNHTAWRHNLDGSVRYVAEVNYSGKGDRYSYTDKENQAAKLTEDQCRKFCSYMKQCDTVGFWS